MKAKLRLNKNLVKGWKGVLIYWIFGLIVLYIVGVRSTSLYLLFIFSVPLIHFTNDEDTVFYIIFGILSAFLIYKFIGLLTGTSLPLVAVVSKSMLHDPTTPTVHYQWLERNLGINQSVIDSWPLKNGFDRGDVLVVVGVNPSNLKVGDVIVFDANQGYPVVHRVIKIEDGKFYTKGDHNPVQDPWVITPEKIYGKAVFVIPKIGYFKIILAEVWYSIFGR
ncbi:MAG: signal peptidase I [Candidatus Aenigmarchaeota archaeon]|nr:signal peptidase I [Candidatus Aenigmarchaeota archaeon]